MFHCPNCQSKLQGTETEGGLYWSCKECGGLAMKVSLLRKNVAQRSLDALWMAANKANAEGKRCCVACRQPMAYVPLTLGEEKVLALDVCRPCSLVWFDAYEFQQMPPADQDSRLSKEGRQALAQLEVALLADRAREAYQQACRERQQIDHAKTGLAAAAIIQTLGIVLNAMDT